MTQLKLISNQTENKDLFIKMKTTHHSFCDELYADHLQ